MKRARPDLRVLKGGKTDDHARVADEARVREILYPAARRIRSEPKPRPLPPTHPPAA